MSVWEPESVPGLEFKVVFECATEFAPSGAWYSDMYFSLPKPPDCLGESATLLVSHPNQTGRWLLPDR